MKAIDFLRALPDMLEARGATAQMFAIKVKLSVDDVEALLHFEERPARFRVFLTVLHALKGRLEAVDDMTPTAVLKHIDHCRANQGMTKQSLATLAGVNRSHLIGLLGNPKCDPKLATVLRLAAAVGYDLPIGKRTPAPQQPAEPQDPTTPPDPSSSPTLEVVPPPLAPSPILAPGDAQPLPSLAFIVPSAPVPADPPVVDKAAPSTPTRRRPPLPEVMQPKFLFYTPIYIEDEDSADDDETAPTPRPAEVSPPTHERAHDPQPAPPVPATPPPGPAPASTSRSTSPPPRPAPATRAATRPTFNPPQNLETRTLDATQDMQAKQGSMLALGTAATALVGGTLLLRTQAPDGKGATQGLLAVTGGTAGATGLACEKGSIARDTLTGSGSGLLLAAAIDRALVMYQKWRGSK